MRDPTARRHTDRGGAAPAAAVAAEQAPLEATAAPPPPGPAKLLESTDGAMVHVVGGGWQEVRTLVLGVVGEPEPDGKGGSRIPCTALTSFSRLLSAEAFTAAASPELHRRGLEAAGAVASVNDGAEWCQTFIAEHRPDAVRILDFPHAAQRIHESFRLALGDRPETRERAAAVVEALRERGPAPVVAALEALEARDAEHPELPRLRENREYLRKRTEQLDYPGFRAAGWPIGSGCVESANKLVVEARLKGAGMRWARHHVNPLLALRNGGCNGRWDETWRGASARLVRPPSPGRPAKERVATPPPSSAEPRPLPEPPARPAPKLLPPPSGHPWRQHQPGYFSRAWPLCAKI